MSKFEFSEISEAADAVRDYIILNKGNLPEHVRDRLHALTRAGTSPVDLVATFVRAAFASSDDFTKQGKKIAAAAADLVDLKGFHGHLDGKAGKMALALTRDAGVAPPAGKSWPAKDKDPEPDAEFVKPADPVEPPPAPDGELEPAPEPGPPPEPINEVVVEAPPAEARAARRRSSGKGGK